MRPRSDGSTRQSVQRIGELLHVARFHVNPIHPIGNHLPQPSDAADHHGDLHGHCLCRCDTEGLHERRLNVDVRCPQHGLSIATPLHDVDPAVASRALDRRFDVPLDLEDDPLGRSYRQ